LATLKRLVGYKWERKSITQKDSFIYNIGRFGCRKEQTFAVITASAKALMGLYLSKE